LLVVTAAGETILAADFRVGLARVNVRAMHLRQHAGHEHSHSGTVTRTIDDRNDALGDFLIVNEKMTKIPLGALQ
jgi:hypothetical protein